MCVNKSFFFFFFFDNKTLLKIPYLLPYFENTYSHPLVIRTCLLSGDSLNVVRHPLLAKFVITKEGVGARRQREKYEVVITVSKSLQS